MGRDMDDETLLRRFEACSIAREQWTHLMHVRVAYAYLERHGFDDAVDHLRTGILKLNEHLGVPDGPGMGYDETTTVAFMHLIDATRLAYRESHPVENSLDFVEMHPQLATRHALRLFYSPGRRLHPDAKTTFVPPDLAPLPRRTD